jgi:hypothetical protein
MHHFKYNVKGKKVAGLVDKKDWKKHQPAAESNSLPPSFWKSVDDDCVCAFALYDK